ncbi:MAG: aldo/keto reductase [Clostridia bacterium]|nr:aldo/keto reductase [Clostridia bacterium]
MKRNRFGRTGYEISMITYGGIVSTSKEFNGYTFSGDGQAESDKSVAWALEHDVNYFDVAPSYGDAMEKLGNSLVGKRDGIVLAAKTGKRDYDGAAREFEESLRLLHTDHFDVYQLHAVSSMDDVERAFAPDGAMKLMRDMKEQGVIRCAGITGHNEKACLEALARYDFDTLLFPVNWLMHMGYGFAGEIIKTAKARDMGLLGMKSQIERAFKDGDEAARARFPKSWCKPFDPQTQADLLLAAMKYSYSLGVDTLIPAGNFEHFSFAVEHADEIASIPMTEQEKKLLAEHLPQVKAYPFMHGEGF